MRNCPNCGAPFEIENNKCQYCGTSVLDFSGIDFTNNKPIYLIMRTEQYCNGDFVPYEIAQKVIPRIGTIEFNADSEDICDSRGNIIRRCNSYNYCTTNVSFEGIPMDDGSLCKIVNR